MTLTDKVAKDIIRRLLSGEDYRIEVITLIDAEFLQYVVGFFKNIIDAKLKNVKITADWYKQEFLSRHLSSDEIAINSGLNKKTISNMYNTTKREVVILAANDHYDELYNTIKALVDDETGLNVVLTIKFNGVSVDLDVSETLIVINTIAVKRAALRGALWSTAGKRVEKPLMQTLCKLYGVPERNYRLIIDGIDKTEAKLQRFEREIDFFLVSADRSYKCEVKLMGKGNPESADAVIARASKVFVADKLSDTNKRQLDSLDVEWVELRGEDGYKKFGDVLSNLGIPHTRDGRFSTSELDRILAESF